MTPPKRIRELRDTVLCTSWATSLLAEESRAGEQQCTAESATLTFDEKAAQRLPGFALARSFYRDVKLCTIGERTSEIQWMVIGHAILKVHPSRG